MKNSNGYSPNPVSLDAIILPDEIMAAVEQIAEQVHEQWAANKMAQGFVYGEVTSDTEKTHKDLKPYSELTDAEKAYDRETAIASLKLVYSLHYRIVRAED